MANEHDKDGPTVEPDTVPDESTTPTSGTDTGGSDTAPAASAAPAAPTWPKRVVVVASILLITVVAAGVWLIIDQRSADERDERRAAFVQAARQTVLNLTTIRADSADADVQRLIDGATGDFKAEFEGREGPFVEVVQQAGVTTMGEVLEAGIQNEDGTCASSLVASRAMVSNADQTEPEPRDFRLRVTICDENGRLLASKVEFVP